MSPRLLSRLFPNLMARAWPPPGRRRLLLLVAPPALAAAVLGAVLLFLAPGAPGAAVAPARVAAGGAPRAGAGDAEAAAAVPPPAGLLVEVSGAVARPGIYRVAKGERVSAAIAAAGGLAGDADPDRMPNLAARLKDGQQVLVPRRGAPGRGSGTSGSRTSTVSLNTASADQLAAVPGFSAELAAAVVEYRTQYGGFTTTRELVDVLQMSQADYQVAKRYVRI
jgi:competence protein ComEA